MVYRAPFVFTASIGVVLLLVSTARLITTRRKLCREKVGILEPITSPHIFILDRFLKRSTNGAKFTTMETKALLIGMFGFSSKSCSNKQVFDSGENARI